MKDFAPLWFVIPNWNLKDDLLECVQSVVEVKNALPELEAVVVDNGSTDGSTEAVTEVFGDKIRVIEIGANKGFAFAANRGIEFSLERGASSIFLLNNDAIVTKSAVIELLRATVSSGLVDILGPSIYYASSPNRLWRLGDRRSRILGGIPVAEYPRSRRAVQLDYVTGCAMLIHRSVFDRIGLFDEEFFMYYEDADFCHRAVNSGCRIIGVPSARVFHKVSRSSMKDPALASYWRAFGLVRFVGKHFADFNPVFISLFVLFKILQMSLHSSGIPEFRRVLAGVKQALIQK